MSVIADLTADAACATALPRLVRLNEHVTAVAFDVMKVLPAHYMIERAVAEGLITEGTVVVETTSGTFGLGLAMVCALRGIPLHLVSDPAIEGALYDRIVDLGARITVVREPAAVGGYQAARLDALERIRAGYPSTYVPSQYGNVNNPRAYAAVAAQIVEHVRSPAWIVGPVGSGGSMCGTVRAVREVIPEVKAVGVDTHNSRLFGQQDGPRLLRGLGNSLLPPNLDHTVFDEVHWITAELAFAATRALHRRHALYMGPTSGAAHLVAEHVARRANGGGGQVVVLLPDHGHRYADTVYNDAWLRAELGRPPISAEASGTEPEWRRVPPRHGTGWQALDWSRRSLADVLASAAAAR